MATDDQPGEAGPRAATVPTGESVRPPVSFRGTMRGATFAIPKTRASALLPDGLEPIRATLGGAAALTLMSVDYHEVDASGVDPYDQLAVFIPASHESPSRVPYVSPLTQGTNGYVQFMAVSTDASKRLGRELWGFPKVRAEITHEDEGSERRTTVTIDGQRFVTLAVDKPRTIQMEDDGFVYNRMDDQLLRVPSTLDGEVGLWPFSDAVSVSVGDHPKAEPLRELDLDSRALGRLSLDGELTFHQAEVV